MNMDEVKFVPFDPSKFLGSDEAIKDHLEDAMDSGDAKVIAGAIGDVARAKGMSQLARETGMSRESLYRALSEEGNPQLSTVLKVLEAMGLKLSIELASKSDAA
jgi:probable addiction module antidote protein